jgi:arylformamidase
MPVNERSMSRPTTRRQVLTIIGAGATAAVAARPAFAQQECRVGPPPHKKGPRVFLDYDQVELDAAYFQPAYEPNFTQVAKRYASNSEITRARFGQPQRFSYGPTEIEKLDIYPTKRSNAPIFVFIHGGAWRVGLAKTSAFPAETFVNAGAHYVVPDFVWVQNAGGSLMPMADQVRRAVAWVYKNAKSFGGDPNRLYVGGHSSGGHLAGVVLTTSADSGHVRTYPAWRKKFLHSCGLKLFTTRPILRKSRGIVRSAALRKCALNLLKAASISHRRCR